MKLLSDRVQQKNRTCCDDDVIRFYAADDTRIEFSDAVLPELTDQLPQCLRIRQTLLHEPIQLYFHTIFFHKAQLVFQQIPENLWQPEHDFPVAADHEHRKVNSTFSAVQCVVKIKYFRMLHLLLPDVPQKTAKSGDRPHMHSGTSGFHAVQR